jgi:CSLREA domain-containing protein
LHTPGPDLKEGQPVDARNPAARLAAALVVAASATAALAETITVNSVADRPDADLGDGVCDADLVTPGLQCTLRAAVHHANQTAEDDVILLPAGTYALTIKGAEENAGATGDLDVTGVVEIRGDDAATTIVDGKKAKDRVFDVRSGAEAVISGVTIRRGKTPRGESGGGVRSDGDLTLDGCVVASCKASDDAGGVDVQSGVTLIRRTWITKCKTRDDGGGFDMDGGSVTLDATTISKCKSGSEGGGLENSGGVLALLNCTISGNQAKTTGGGISLEDGGTLDIDGSTVAFNKAKFGGGISLADDDFGPNTCRVRGSIFAKNKKTNSDRPVTSLGGNVETGSAMGFELSSTDPKLGKLASDGIGVTTAPPSHPIGPDSPAAEFVTSGCLATDQRGVLRGATCSAGAYEFNLAPQ